MSIQTKTIFLNGNPSYQPNNLSFSFETDSVAYVKKSEVNIQQLRSRTTKKIPAPSSTCDVCTAAFVDIQDTDLLVIASSAGVQVWTADGNSMRYFCPIEKMDPSIQSGSTIYYDQFLNGIASLSSGYIFVGSSIGKVHVLNIPADGGDFQELPAISLGASKLPISAITASDDVVAYGNESGEVFFHKSNPTSGFEFSFQGGTMGPAVTSMASMYSNVAVASTIGQIDVYNVVKEMRVISVAAHARSVMGLSLNPDTCTLASCSDDQLVSIWQFPNSEKGTNDMELLSSHRVESKMLVGVAHAGSEVYLTAYEEQKLFFVRT